MKARDFWFKNWYFPSSACCSQLSVSHRYLVAFTMVQWLACDVPHLKRSLISSALQLKRLAWVQWLTLKQCNSQLVTFLQIRDILIDYRHRASLIFLLQLPVLLSLLLLLLISIQLSNLIIKYYRQWSNLSSLNSLSLALPERQ